MKLLINRFGLSSRLLIKKFLIKISKSYYLETRITKCDKRDYKVRVVRQVVELQSATKVGYRVQ